ncbi:hypothetical protein DPMN_114190 [Dreissena polymorpha]|uniref:Uncharacterized protein n=1 Tax=Dreissena polymorpha TaxID=45954 RepID=A0A9D4QRH6_DREPO|nr:hypothetical protein DPMN_114190 [Dreissena polymorpha]
MPLCYGCWYSIPCMFPLVRFKSICLSAVNAGVLFRIVFLFRLKSVCPSVVNAGIVFIVVFLIQIRVRMPQCCECWSCWDMKVTMPDWKDPG